MNEPETASPLPTNWLGRLVARWRRPDARAEFKALIDDHDEEKENLSADEKDLISAVLDFDDATAEDVCIPRSEINFVRAADDFATIWQAFVTSRHSRLPVVGEDLDDVKGFLTLKDVVPFADKNGKGFDLNQAMRRTVFVPAAMPLPDVLRQVRASRSALVLVADEYGGTMGLLTLKDIIEELVGDLDDEHAPAVSVQLIPVGPNRYSVDPRAELSELAEQLKQPDLEPNEDSPVDTIGGLVLQQAGRVPAVDETFTLPGGSVVKVLDSDGRRLHRLRLELPSAAE